MKFDLKDQNLTIIAIEFQLNLDFPIFPVFSIADLI